MGAKETKGIQAILQNTEIQTRMSEEAYYSELRQQYGVYPDEDGRPNPEDACPVCDRIDCSCPPESSDATPIPQSNLLHEETGNAPL